MASFSHLPSSLGPIAGLVALMTAIGIGCSSSSDSLPSAHADNPLPECPNSPNCERVSTAYAVSPDTLFAGTQRALNALGPAQIQVEEEARRASAAYRVAWVFTDDVEVAVQPHEKGSRLHVRSASRVGHDDFGVNHRRVQRLLSAVDDALSSE